VREGARLPHTVFVGYRYLLLNKPYGVLSQFTREEGTSHGTLADYVDVKGVYAAGRLDGDSEGLLLLTDDGAMQKRLTDPRFGHERTYWVQVEGLVSEEALRELREGVMVQGHRTLPAFAEKMAEAPALWERVPAVRYRASIPTSWIALTLTEGRNRQVRRMTAAVGYPTLRLVRARIGDLGLDGLGVGEWRELTAAEIKALGRGRRGTGARGGRGRG
jgi:23S rRNA pseudouridine2457 synthase